MGKGSVALVDVNGAEQQKRFKRTAVLQEVYMGQWEVSNEAVNIAMTELRNQVRRARGCSGSSTAARIAGACALRGWSDLTLSSSPPRTHRLAIVGPSGRTTQARVTS